MFKSESTSDLISRLEWAEKTLVAIMNDEKPVVDPANPSQSWLLDQIARMHAGFFVTDYPNAYTTTPQEAAELARMDGEARHEYIRKTKGLFPHHTMNQTFIEDTKTLSAKLEARNISGMRLLGTDYEARKPDFEGTTDFYKADGFMLGKSDFFGMHQFIRSLRMRVDQDSPPSPLKPLILHNYKSFWDPMITGLGLGKALEEKNVFITGRLSRLPEIAERAHVDLSRPAAQIKPFIEIPPGATILVATRQNRKIHELQEIFNGLGANIRVLPFHIVVGRPKEAAEESGSYIGNNVEKLNAVIEKLAKADSEETNSLLLNLKRYNIDAMKTYILVDDRGEEYATDFFDGPEFEDARSLMNPHKRPFGVEMANILKAMPNMSAIYDRIKKAFDRMTGEGKNPTLDAYDIACYAIAPLHDVSRVMAVTATTEDIIEFHPDVQGRQAYSEDYLRLKNDPQQRIKSQIPNYMKHYSTMALAIRGLARLTGLYQHEGELQPPEIGNDFAQSSHDNRQGRWRIGMPQSFSMGAHFFKAQAALKGITRGFTRHFDLIASRRDKEGPHDLYDLSVKHSYTVQEDTPEGRRVPWYSSLVSAARYEQDMDGFYFRPHRRDEQTLGEEIAGDFDFFSRVVGKQTFNPSVHPKPFVVARGYAQRQIENYKYLHFLGLIGDKPEHIYHAVSSKSQARAYFLEKFKNYVRQEPVEAPLSIEGENNQDLMRVTFYMSASTKNKTFNTAARKGGYLAADLGFQAQFGGGNDGSMREFGEGFLDFRKEEAAAGNGARVVNNLVAIQCIDTIESEGEFDNADRKERHPTIYHRMDNLQKTDIEIFLAGGAGTLQEFYATCISRLRNSKVEDRPIILVNEKITCQDKEYGVWQELIRSMPKELIHACNIHIVDTIEEAMDIAVETRQKRGMDKIIRPNASNDSRYRKGELVAIQGAKPA